MKRILTIVLFMMICASGFSSTILFPEFTVFAQLHTNLAITTSYMIDMVIDTGIKYGVKIGLGLNGYDLTSITSNTLALSSLKIYSRPFDLFDIGFFAGKNTRLGYYEFGYQGFQYHQKPNLEYMGYKQISGIGMEAYISLFDNMLEPHLYLYSPNPTITASVTNTNSLNLDFLLNFQFADLTLQGYAGINMDIENLTIFLSNLNLGITPTVTPFYFHIGGLVKIVYGKLDFIMSAYLPDDLNDSGLNFDKMYINITEHLIAGNFEQTLSLFTRPWFYNETEETYRNDLDVYLSLGAIYETAGVGLEAILTMGNSGANIDTKIGIYSFFILNNLKYRFGVFYSIPLVGSAVFEQYGGFVNISGTL